MNISMKLRSYLNKTGKTPETFGPQIGVDPVSVRRYMAGTRRPDWKVLDRIVRETGGLVTANDFLPDPDQDEPTRPNRQASACAA